MALPSSPPLFPELEPPSSPPLPTASFLSPALPGLRNLRKRQLPEEDSALSSDPFFSEDPSEGEDAALYANPRRKKMIRRKWWEEGMASRDVTNNDSGVFMGSDLSSDDLVALPRPMHSLRRVGERSQRPAARQVHADVQPVAQQIVFRSIDAGRETFDLSSLDLTRLSADTLSPIRHLIRQSHINTIHPPSEDEFVSMIPEVKLFLAHNRLSRLPPELFDLQHLTVLSLRNNELTELHPAIAYLGKLTELNISGNWISYLPWELLGLMICRGGHRQITVRPNPLLEPMVVTGRSMISTLPVVDQAMQARIEQAENPDNALSLLKQHYGQHGDLDQRADFELRLTVGRIMRSRYLDRNSIEKDMVNACGEELIYLASSTIKYLGITGNPVQRLPSGWAFPVELDSSTKPVMRESVPSLFECALKSAQKNYVLDDLPTEIPSVISNALRHTADADTYGNEKCTTCGRFFIIARAEWVEYWFNGLSSQQELTQETVLPFMRRACSWLCAWPTGVGGFRC